MIKKIFSGGKFDQKFLQGGFFLYAGSMIVNLANYIFHLIVARNLGPVSYGVVVTLISLLTVLSIPASAISTIATKFASEEAAKNELGEIKELLTRLSGYLLLLGLAIFTLLWIFAPLLGNYLNIDSIYLRIISIFIIFSFLIALNRGIIQGLKRFRSLSFNLVIEPLAKIGVFVMLFFLGWKIMSAVWALVASITLAYIFSFLPLKKILKSLSKIVSLKKIWRYSWYTLLVFLFLTTLTYIDVLLVKHYFTQEDAGLYAALSTIGKVILYLSMPIILVMFPFVSEAQAKGERHFPLLFQTILVVSGFSLLVLLVYYLDPTLVVKVLYGSSFLAISPNLFLIGLAFSLLSLDYIFIYYFLSIKNLTFLFYLAATLIIELFLIYHSHDSINSIIDDLIFSFGFLLLVLSLKYISSKRTRLKSIWG